MIGEETTRHGSGQRLTAAHAKRTLKQRGHSYRSAASALGCSLRHLHAVLNGERASGRLLKRILAITTRAEIPRNSPYRARTAG